MGLLLQLFLHLSHTRNSVSLHLCCSVYLPASSGGWPSPTSCPSKITLPPLRLSAEASHFTTVCTLCFRCCLSIGAPSWGEAWLCSSPEPRELGSTDSCIKDKAVQGKCSQAPWQLQTAALSCCAEDRPQPKWILSIKSSRLLRLCFEVLMLWRERVTWGWAEEPGCCSLMDEWPLHTGTCLASWNCLDAWTGCVTEPGGLMPAADTSIVSAACASHSGMDVSGECDQLCSTVILIYIIPVSFYPHAYFCSFSSICRLGLLLIV